MTIQHAIILAAGRGSRMGQLTDQQPKCLTRYRGKTLLEQQMQALSDAGCQSVALVTGYRAEQLAPYAETTFHHPRWAETNMVQSLCAASPWLSTYPCVVSYSDIFYTPETVRTLAASPAELAISYDPLWVTQWQGRFEDPLSDAETFVLDAQSNLIDIGQRATTIEMIQGQYMGLIKFTPTSWALLCQSLSELPEAAAQKIDMTSLLRRLIQQGLRIQATACVGEWGEIDSASDLHFFEQNQQATID